MTFATPDDVAGVPLGQLDDREVAHLAQVWPAAHAAAEQVVSDIEGGRRSRIRFLDMPLFDVVAAYQA